MGIEYGLDLHTWHCHDYAKDVRRDLGIATGPAGLLRTNDDARRVLAWLETRPLDEAPEPVPWIVVALADVPVSHHGDGLPAR